MNAIKLLSIDEVLRMNIAQNGQKDVIRNLDLKMKEIELEEIYSSLINLT